MQYRMGFAPLYPSYVSGRVDPYNNGHAKHHPAFWSTGLNSPSNQLFDAYFTQPAMRAVFSDQGRVQGMLGFEAALARAEASVGLVPQDAVAPIAAACKAELYDLAALARRIGRDAAQSPGGAMLPPGGEAGRPPGGRSRRQRRGQYTTFRQPNWTACSTRPIAVHNAFSR
ncbi:3-carboxy-cis,cis-muconate cycloisomerase [compost metagenome]